MAIKVAVNHQTKYEYDRLISLSPHVFRLRPAVYSRTPVKAYSLTIRPGKHFINWQQDPFGKFLARVVFPEKTRELYIEVDLVAEMTVINPFDFFVEEYSENFPFTYPEQLRKELAPYLEITEQCPLLKGWLPGIDRSEPNTVTFLVKLNHRLFEAIRYTIRMEPGVQTCEETLKKVSGSCRDSAWLLVQILRHLGLAARFVSGYLIQLTADMKALDGPSGPHADFTDLHAWAEVYVPGAGWIGLDPTSGLFAGEGHIPLACRPDDGSAAPVSGFTDECQTRFSFKNTVRRIHEDPRVTKPYTEIQWTAINALGQKVEKNLINQDVRLSKGGEPTFVSIDDMEAPEWNIAALGKHKRKLAGDLIVRLRQVFAPGGMLHYGQGKWYPGEPLPRLSLPCFWCKDDIATWKDMALFADETRDYGFTIDYARKFIENLCRRLDIDGKNIVQGYEDIYYLMWAEEKLPVNVNPLSYDLKDPAEGKRLVKILAGDIGKPSGWVIPIAKDQNVDIVHTALCAEARDGKLYVFLLPVTYLEHYLKILASVESTAKEVSMPVILEGYTPPEDPRIKSLKVTPDPGVIEVNIHPSENWEDLVKNIEVLYEQARMSRLGTEKFMLDGRHTGTGGGNHVTIGGIKPSDSPILRRPDLLCSMITYWQHHPGLSYLFSGMFIGPTSESPRVDEGRVEQLYELEIELRMAIEPWYVLGEEITRAEEAMTYSRSMPMKPKQLHL